MFIYFVGDIKIYKEFIQIFVLNAYFGYMHYYMLLILKPFYSCT